MKNRREWETKSLEWIHKVREEIDEEIKRQGVSLAEWTRARGRIDVQRLCRKLGLRNYTIIRNRVKPRVYHGETTQESR